MGERRSGQARGHRTHEEILASAAQAIRLDGVASVTVARVMLASGKTHGGFYSHFDSKDELVIAAVERLLDLPVRLFERLAAGPNPAAGVAIYVGYYLSPAHRDDCALGCPFPALVSDLARVPPGLRDTVGNRVRLLADAIDGRLGQASVRPAAPTTAAIGEMIGALALARAVADPGLSGELLDGARGSVLAKLGLERLADVALAAGRRPCPT